MLKHYVTIIQKKELPYGYGSELRPVFENIEVDADTREWAEKFRVPEGAYAFKFFDRNEHICEDGELLKGKKKNESPTYYIGKFYTMRQLLDEFGEKYKSRIDSLIGWWHEERIWRCTDEDEEDEEAEVPNRFVMDFDGDIHLLKEDDVVIEVRV